MDTPTPTTPVKPEPIGIVHIPEHIKDDHPNVYPMLVTGDSMTGDLINEGDAVLVDPDLMYGDGDIVVVHVTDWRSTDTDELISGCIVRRLTNGGTVLEPSNPKYQPRPLLPEHRAKVQGVVIWNVKSSLVRKVVK